MALVVPTWLDSLAALRDSPPQAIPREIVARLAKAGAVELIPLRAGERLDPAAVEQADALGVAGPGFGFGETLEEEPAPVRGALERVTVFVETFDKLRRLRLASIDMRLVAETARALLDPAGPARAFERMLETALVVTYARSYLESSRAGVGEKWWPRESAEREIHERVIEELRHPYHAHSDRTPHRTIIDTAAVLGIDGPPTYAEAWWQLTDEELTRIAELAERQQERLEAEARRVGAKLGEARP